MDQTFDYVVVGGGSGGAVVAGRLSEDSNTSVCVLEAGGKGDGLVVRVPMGAVAMLPTKINNWAFETVPQKGLNNRKGYQPRGKALGGSSAVNAMAYIRGHRVDYDQWAALGNTGWGYEDVLPYFRLAENNERIINGYHGQGGPLNVADLRSDNPLQQVYLQAARQAGFPITDDFNGEQQEGIGIYQVTQKDGERCSTARAYLHPYMGVRQNLDVKTGAMVQRILFEGKRAVGVEVLIDGQFKRIGARREVVLAAGAFQTPQILMLSGIGDADHIAAKGITPLVNLPGVGLNLQDHPDFIFGYSSNSTHTLGVSLRGTWKMMTEFFRFRNERRGMLTSNFAEGGGFLKTDASLDAPDIQLHFVVALVDDHARKFHLSHGFSCHFCLLRPASRGSVTLRTPDPQDAPVIDPAFLAEQSDVDAMVKGFRLTKKLMDAPALAPYIKRDLFTQGVTSDDAIVDILRKRVDTVYHPVGTCRMGTDDKAVVDAQLRVRGVEGLRIADASIMPTLIGGNTNAPVVMIAEKAVDLITGRSRVGTATAAMNVELVNGMSI